MAQQIITQPCQLESCERVFTYEYKGHGPKRKYCSTACRKAAKKAQDASRDRHGERQRIRARRQARQCRNALRGMSDREVDESGLTVRGRESSLRAGPTGPPEGRTAGIPMRDLSKDLEAIEWFANNPDWDKDL